MRREQLRPNHPVGSGARARAEPRLQAGGHGTVWDS